MPLNVKETLVGWSKDLTNISFLLEKIHPELTSVANLPLSLFFFSPKLQYMVVCLVVSPSSSSMWATVTAWLPADKWCGSVARNQTQAAKMEHVKL